MLIYNNYMQILSALVYYSICISVFYSVSFCVCERERERETCVCVCVCVFIQQHKYTENVKLKVSPWDYLAVTERVQSLIIAMRRWGGP